LKLPGRDDLLDYVENAAGQDAEAQKSVLQLLASSKILREQMAEVKRDLYLVGAQIPDYTPDAAFGAEIMRLSQTWIRAVYERKFSLKQFYRSQEFMGLLLALAGLLLLAVGLLGFHLIGSGF
jgi:hypothetical protein